eukprot:CAMPEP_0175289672 /NCGR_PEP_ID=MMETSP0093-20121207/55457_1 /TAXON_ID=311494 /ORGANISM="Alexandrium monilatum, Strain CCMP3105" /LENGTH=42 /DNA_ID= /DNA_START= /DNA_END= /DNA_ORIENTATION=
MDEFGPLAPGSGDQKSAKKLSNFLVAPADVRYTLPMRACGQA